MLERAWWAHSSARFRPHGGPEVLVARKPLGSPPFVLAVAPWLASRRSVPRTGELS